MRSKLKLWLVVCALVVAESMSACAVNLQNIISDNFTAPVTADINAYLEVRQHGLMALLPYTTTALSWQLKVSPSYGLRVYTSGGAPAPSASLTHNFTETGEFHLRIKMQPVTCSYCFVDVGSPTNVPHPGTGIAFEIYSNKTIKFYAEGSAVTAATAQLSGAGPYTLDVYVSTDPGFVSGGYSAVINARINGDILDLNGSAGGYNYTATNCLLQNFITLGAYHGTGGTSIKEGRIRDLWLFDRTPLHGVGWWHGCTGTNDAIGQQMIKEVSPPYFQERIPYYGQIIGRNSCTFGSTNNQATMDKQLDYAIAAGLNYIVWDETPPAIWPNNKIYEYGLQMYLASTRQAQLPFCLDITSASSLLTDSTWTEAKAWYLALLANTNYFKVLDDRPLLYVFNVKRSYIDNGTYATAIARLGELSAASVAQGSGKPYIVGYCWSYDEITNAVAHFGSTIDAYSRYAGGVAGPWTWNDYRNVLSHKYMPEASTGWDPFPRMENPSESHDYARSAWRHEETPDVITESLQQAQAWVSDNPLSAEVPLVHSFGWTDQGEGGRVIPSMFKGVDRINAFSRAITGTNGILANFKVGTASLNDNWTTISFSTNYDYPPVVILGVPSATEATPVVTRVRNVTTTNFEARIQEFECANGTHSAETVHWLAIPPGTYTIDGRKVYAAKTWVTDSLRLFGDAFPVPGGGTNGVNYDITDRGTRLEGFTAYEHVIPYLGGPNGLDSQQTVGYGWVKLWPNANLASITPNYNFKETGRFRIEATTKVNTAEYNVIAFGSQYANEGNPADGFAVRIYSNGTIRCWSRGNEITAATTNISSTNYLVKISVATPAAFDGTGTAYIRVTVNGTPIDFNGGEAGGLTYSCDGLANNYITLGSYHSGGGKYGMFSLLKLFDESMSTFVPIDKFDAPPVVLAQVETAYTTNAVVPRIYGVTSNSFQIYLQQQETNSLFTSDGYKIHDGEITGFVAIEAGTSTNRQFTAGLKSGITDAEQGISFDVSGAPHIFATLNTFNNFDPVVLRCSSLGSANAALLGQEETSYDSETSITNSETAGWAVLGGE